MRNLTSLELCAGAGGQALGLERAGFSHEGLVEIDPNACQTIRNNRPGWNVIEGSVEVFDGSPYKGIDLLAGGLPCPPFSKAGKQLGTNDERNLFPAAIRLIDEIRPRAIMIENVRGILDPVFNDFRTDLKSQLAKLGYESRWQLFNAKDFGVPQSRQRAILVALRPNLAIDFSWPQPLFEPITTVGETLLDLMSERGWRGAHDWRLLANDAAPTLVGGSKKHGGPDLGPTRARLAWQKLGVDGRGIADFAPDPDFVGMPKLTVKMVSRLQGFPDDWPISGKKTTAYRQVGNAFPPPVAHAIADEIRKTLLAERVTRVS